MEGFSNVKQNDPKWRDYPFGDGGETFWSSACGLFAISIILGFTVIEQIMQVYTYLKANGWVTDHSGTWQCGIYKALQHFGVQAEQITPESIGKRKGTSYMVRAKNHVIDGFTLVLLMGSAKAGTGLTNNWTSGGHYITVVGYDPYTGMFLVHDPAGRMDGWHYWDEFEGDVKHVYLVYKSWNGTSKDVEVEDVKIYKNIKQVKLGDEGLEVLLLQEVLIARGIKADQKYGGSGNELKMDKKLGFDTQAALMWYQEQRGLKVDGICGPASWCDLLGGI